MKTLKQTKREDFWAKILYLVITVSSLLSFVLLLDKLQQSEVQQQPKQETYEVSKQEKECLVEALFFEIRNGDSQAMSNVADVILNRVNTKGFPDNVCDVVKEPKQFSYRNSYKPSNDWQDQVLRKGGKDAVALEQIHVIAEQKLINGPDNTEILWYTTPSTKRQWMKKLKVKFNDGWHKFMVKHEHKEQK